MGLGPPGEESSKAASFPFETQILVSGRVSGETPTDLENHVSTRVTT